MSLDLATRPPLLWRPGREQTSWLLSPLDQSNWCRVTVSRGPEPFRPVSFLKEPSFVRVGRSYVRMGTPPSGDCTSLCVSGHARRPYPESYRSNGSTD